MIIVMILKGETHCWFYEEHVFTEAAENSYEPKGSIELRCPVYCPSNDALQHRHELLRDDSTGTRSS
jgi:hypothetical protein